MTARHQIPGAPRARAPLMQLLLAGLILLAGTGNRSTGLLASAIQESSHELQPQKPVTGTLKGAVKYRFALKTNEFFQLALERTGMDYGLSIFAPDGQVM